MTAKAKLVKSLEVIDVHLSSQQQDQLLNYLTELLRWNKRINLTSIDCQDVALEKHLIDSLYLCRWLKDAKTFIDLGSGAGLPSIPVAIAKPKLNVYSVDSIGKKVNFQRHIKRLLQLHNLWPLCERIENLAGNNKYPEFQIITARAFTALEKLVLLGSSLLKSEGVLLAMRGPDGKDELKMINNNWKKIGFYPPQVFDYNLPESHAARTLILFKKI